MAKSNAIYLSDMLRAIEVINQIIREKSPTELQAEPIYRGGLERHFEIVAEASKHLHTELKTNYPEIPWKSMISLGNLLRHEYAKVSVGVLCRIANIDLPVLEKVCRAELEREQTSPRSVGELLEAGERLMDKRGAARGPAYERDDNDAPQIDDGGGKR